MSMRIAFITYQYPPFVFSGGGVWATHIAQELARLDTEVHIITSKAGTAVSSEEDDSGVFVHRIPITEKRFISAPSFWMNLRRQYRSLEAECGGFDIVHGDSLSDFSLPTSMISVPRISSIHHLARDTLTTLRPGLFQRIANPGSEFGAVPYIEKWCIGRADKLVTVSKYTRQRMVEIYGIKESMVEVVYDGIDPDFTPRREEERKKSRLEYGLTNEPVILFVGSLDERKGLSYLLKALPRIRDSVNPEVQLYVVGRGDQTPYRALVSSLGIERAVIFTGGVDDSTLKKMYALSDVFVLPSLLEGFGIVLAEAMARGLPVVSTNVGGIPEVVGKENGILVEPRDSEALVEAIGTYLANKKLAGEVGLLNSKSIPQKFSWKQSAKKLKNIYELLLD